MRSSITATLQSFKADRQPAEVFVPSIVGLTLVVLIGFTLGFLMRHGLGHPFDKGVHAIFFAALLFFAGSSLRSVIIPPIVIVVAIALGSEFLQAILPHRDMSYGDIAANMVGCCAGFCLLTGKNQFINLCEKSPLFKNHI